MWWVWMMCPHHKYHAHSLSESGSNENIPFFQWQHCFYLDIYNIYPFRRKWFCNLEPPSAPLFRGIQCLGLATESRGLLPDETRHVRKKVLHFLFPTFFIVTQRLSPHLTNLETDRLMEIVWWQNLAVAGVSRAQFGGFYEMWTQYIHDHWLMFSKKDKKKWKDFPLQIFKGIHCHVFDI